jgi:hypothetical protein
MLRWTERKNKVKERATDLHTTKEIAGWRLVAHTCNPQYSGGRDQEGYGSRPAPTNSSREPISK